MLSKKSISTTVAKFSLLFANFGLVVLTSQIWGSEGRGEIALINTNILLIGIVNAIFNGTSISYYSNKFNERRNS